MYNPVITGFVLHEQKSLEFRTGHYVAVYIRRAEQGWENML